MNYEYIYQPTIDVNENTNAIDILINIRTFAEVVFVNTYKKSNCKTITEFIKNNNVFVNLNGYLSSKTLNALSLINIEKMLLQEKPVDTTIQNDPLRKLCLECQRLMGEKQMACPWRSISNEYCEEYESIKNRLEILDIIKHNSIITETNQTLEINVELFKCNQEKDIKKIKKWIEE